MSESKMSPRCERMNSRNESFDGDRQSTDSRQETAPVRNDQSLSDESDDNENGDAFVSLSDVCAEEDCLQFFDATQYLNNRSTHETSSTQQEEQQHKGTKTKAEEELQEAVAYSSALVGENVYDSPASNHGGRRNGSFAGVGTPSIPCLRQVTAIPHTTDEGVEVSLMAQGYAWVRNQRESRSRKYLQYQAEQQLLKIKQAQRSAKEPPSKGLFSTPIFQTLGIGNQKNMEHGDLGRSKNSSRSEEDRDMDEFLDAEERHHPHATVSQSGAGYTVEIVMSDSEHDEDASWIPPVRIEEEDLAEENASICLLNKDQRQQIAQHVLPTGIAYAKWKRIYSLARDGDSFDSCLRLIKDYNQTLLIVRTSKNEIFGGYADAAWEQTHLSGAQFYGGPTSCLFTVPDVSKAKIKAFRWTGANRYIQLTDNHRKLLAFGGGGSGGSFGLCVESDFQRGSTGRCETFANEPLCRDENFRIVDVEIFGFLLGQF